MLSALGNGVKGGVWYSLMDKVYAPATLAAAWAKVQVNGGAAGVDRQSIERFAANAEASGGAVRESCGRANTVRRRSGAWKSRKGMAGCGRSGIPTVKDRIAQTAVKFVLEPILEAHFHSGELRLPAGTRS